MALLNLRLIAGIYFHPSARRIARCLLPSGFPFTASSGWLSRTSRCGHHDVLRCVHVPVLYFAARRTDRGPSFELLRGATIRAVSGRVAWAHKCYGDALPSCLVLYLPLDLMEGPRVHPASERGSLAVTLPIQLPDSLEFLHDDS